MREVEVKFLEIDKNKIEEKILLLGGRKISNEKITDIFFDFPDRRLKKKQELIRIRLSSKPCITYKSKKDENSEFKSREELETEISDSECAIAIFEKLGFVRIRHIEKMRKSFFLGEAKIEIDEYPDIPALIEIEGESEDIVKNAIIKLGLDITKACGLNNYDVLKKYGKDPDNAKL